MHFTLPTGPNERLLIPALEDIVPAARANGERLDEAGSIGGVPLGELRAGVRRAVLTLVNRDPDDERPLIVSGHQPGLPHPGILFKHAVLEQVARDAVAINVVVDSDTTELLTAKVPARRDGQVSVVDITMARCAKRVVLGRAPKPERRPFEAQLSEVRRSAAQLDTDEILDALDRFAAIHREEFPEHDSLAALLTAYRRRYFPTPHVHEVFLSALCETDGFRTLAAAVIEEAEGFLAEHNDALEAHRRARHIRTRVNPFPDLRRDGSRIELPLWHIDAEGQRSPVFVERPGNRTTLYAHETPIGEFSSRPQLERLLTNEPLRPKALLLTLFLRLCVGDLFVHGVGGANYDAVTDAVISRLFRIEPPRYGVASLSLRLPLAFDDGLGERVRALTYRLRRMTWNPDEFVAATNPQRAEKQEILAGAGEHLTRPQHERIEAIRCQLLAQLARERDEATQALAEAREALVVQQRLAARDFPYFLYPLPQLQAATEAAMQTSAG